MVHCCHLNNTPLHIIQPECTSTQHFKTLVGFSKPENCGHGHCHGHGWCPWTFTHGWNPSTFSEMLKNLYKCWIHFTFLTLILGGCKQSQGLPLPTDDYLLPWWWFSLSVNIASKIFFPVMHNCWRLLSKKECIGGISVNGLNNISGCSFSLVFSRWHSAYFYVHPEMLCESHNFKCYSS